jgi:hypothetical protein
MIRHKLPVLRVRSAFRLTKQSLDFGPTGSNPSSRHETQLSGPTEASTDTEPAGQSTQTLELLINWPAWQLRTSHIDESRTDVPLATFLSAITSTKVRPYSAEYTAVFGTVQLFDAVMLMKAPYDGGALYERKDKG